MKKQLLTIIAAGASLLALAQVPNQNFENWTHTGGPPAYDEPTNWATLNILSNPLLGSNPITVFKETTNVNGGAACMKIISQALVSNPSPGNIPDTVGTAFLGGINIATQQIYFGTPFTARPATFSWWGRYHMGTRPDSAFAIIALTHWNGSGRDTIAVGENVLPMNYLAWTNFSSTLIYNPSFPNTLPDSLAIIYTACDQFSGHPGDTLWVDDASLTGWTGINEFYKNDMNVQAFPNPANDLVNFYASGDKAVQIGIYDVNGNEVDMQQFYNRKSSLNTENYAEGVYMYAVLDQAGAVISRGKFVVAR